MNNSNSTLIQVSKKSVIIVEVMLVASKQWWTITAPRSSEVQRFLLSI